LLRAARFREAAEHLEKTRRRFGHSAQIELALGTAYYAQRRFEEAGARFFRVIELDPAVHQPYIFLARMIDQIPDRAAEFLARAKAWHESGAAHAFAPSVHARALVTTGAPDAQVKPLLEAAIARDASNWEFHFELAQLYERARDYAAAARAYERSIACEEQRPEPHYRLARIYDRLRKPDDARRQREIHAELIRKEQQRAGVIEP
jgi:tetratricopeptide (TPR) repeat protein